jgi:hypothetical protein
MEGFGYAKDLGSMEGNLFMENAAGDFRQR